MSTLTTQEYSVVMNYNTDVIMPRVSTIFNYELAPVPTSMFQDSGEARYSKTKSVLKIKLKVEVSVPGIQAEAVFNNGGEMLHSAVCWPKDGLVRDLFRSIEAYIRRFIEKSDVYMIFDRYFDNSIRSVTRQIRIDLFRRVHHLAINSPLSANNVCMNSIGTKQQLIEIIATYFSNIATKKALIITSHDIYQEEVKNGVRCKRVDLVTHYDEADYIIPHQVDSVIRNGKRSMKFISAGTDIFVLLSYHFVNSNWSDAEVNLEDFSTVKETISIKKTVLVHINVVPSLPTCCPCTNWLRLSLGK